MDTVQNSISLISLYRKITCMIPLCLGTIAAIPQTMLTCSDLGGAGDLNTRCTLSNHSYTLSDGDVISGAGTLELGNHGELHLAPGSFFKIDMGGDVLVLNGGRIYGNVDITCDNLYIDGAVNAWAKGYGSSEGPGAGTDATDSIEGGSGGGFGGQGGNGRNTVDNGGDAYQFALTQPAELGSGGGEQLFWLTAEGGKGGGAVKVAASGTVTVNGAIGANGDAGFCMGPNYCSGGGSGGSIWVQAGALSGTGSITANGGNGGNGTFSGGGGGGGRIAIYCSTASFPGSITTTGGIGNNGEAGGAGTIYVNDGVAANLTLGNKLHHGALTPLDLAVSQSFDNLIIRDSARLYPFGAPNTLIKNFTVATAGSVTSPVKLSRLNLSLDNLVVEAGGVIDYNGKGYGGAEGLGMGGSVASAAQGAGGGAYGAGGGQGENNGGVGGTGGYGSEYQPFSFGSGGGNINLPDTVWGGYGGGAIWISASDVIQIDGVISANGMDGNASNGAGSGGGSGGSIVLCGDILSGNGTVSADGGAGGNATYAGGGGSGGRLAVYAQNNSFTGGVYTAGGAGFAANSGLDGTLISETDCGTPPIAIAADEPKMSGNDNFGIYPNPGSGTFNLDMYLEEKSDVTIRVVNLIGQEILAEDLSQIEGHRIRQLLMEQATSGIYYLYITTDKGIYNKKLVLQR